MQGICCAQAQLQACKMKAVGCLTPQDLYGIGLQDFEGLWAGHNTSKAVLPILLECEALLPRQPACIQQGGFTFTTFASLL